MSTKPAAYIEWPNINITMSDLELLMKLSVGIFIFT